jgi:hypothetical protein
MPCDKSFGIAYCPTDIHVRALPAVERRSETGNRRPEG